jgi:glutamate/aspartate transport system substrate-binding protein
MSHRLLVSCLLACAFAGPAGAADAILKRVADHKRITLGYAEQAAPISFRSASGPAGYALDLCGAVVERLRRELKQPGLAVSFVAVDQDSVARYVSAGSVDLLCAGVSDTPDRRRTMSFSSPIFISSVKLLVRGGDALKTAADLKGRTVTLLGRTTAESAVNTLNQQQALNLKVSRVVSPEAALSQLRLRQADAWARDEVLLLGALAREPDGQNFALLPEVLSTERIAIAMPLDETMQKFVNETLAELARSGRLEAIYDKWFMAPTGLKLPMSPQLKAEFGQLR